MQVYTPLARHSIVIFLRWHERPDGQYLFDFQRRVSLVTIARSTRRKWDRLEFEPRWNR